MGEDEDGFGYLDRQNESGFGSERCAFPSVSTPFLSLNTLNKS